MNTAELSASLAELSGQLDEAIGKADLLFEVLHGEEYTLLTGRWLASSVGLYTQVIDELDSIQRRLAALAESLPK